MGITQCKKNDTLIITKSMKDILCFRSLMDVDVIAPQGEGNTWDIDTIEWIKKTYKNVFVVMDYDGAGIDAADRLSEYGFTVKWISTKQILVNSKMKVIDKDLSDYITNHSISKAINRLIEMFPELPVEVFKTHRAEYFEKLKVKLAS